MLCFHSHQIKAANILNDVQLQTRFLEAVEKQQRDTTLLESRIEQMRAHWHARRFYHAWKLARLVSGSGVGRGNRLWGRAAATATVDEWKTRLQKPGARTVAVPK